MADEEGKREGAAKEERSPGAAAAKGSSATQRRTATRKGSQKTGSSAFTGVLVGLALLVGGAAGWLAAQAQARTAQPPPTEGGAGACQTWEQKICSEVGQEALACYEAKAAANLLPPAACDSALTSVQDTLAKVAASREVCNSIVTRLCGDLGPESPTCAVVREKTELFPAERCKEMLENYDAVLGELRTFEQQMGAEGMQPGAGDMPPPGAEAP